MCVEWGVSIPKACRALCFDTSNYHYKSRRTDQAAIERRIKEICVTQVRYGYQRVHVLLRREIRASNTKKTRRIYTELGLHLRNCHRDLAHVQPCPGLNQVGTIGALYMVSLNAIGTVDGADLNRGALDIVPGRVEIIELVVEHLTAHREPAGDQVVEA